MKYHKQLNNAVAYLKATGKIRFDADIARSMSFNKGALSSFLSGRQEASKTFINDFQNYYKLRLEDFDTIPDVRSDNGDAVKQKTPDEYQGKYIVVLEQLLNQELKEVKSKIEGLEQRLDKLLGNFSTAEARQKAAFVIVQYMSEELAAVAKDEKNRKKWVDASRREVQQRLEVANPANHK